MRVVGLVLGILLAAYGLIGGIVTGDIAVGAGILLVGVALLLYSAGDRVA